MNAPQHSTRIARRRFGDSWLMLCIVLGAHVYDEAVTDFLAFYNPMVLRLRDQLGFWPMPTFEFLPWITGLVIAVLTLMALTGFAYRGARWMRFVAYPFAVIMLLNGLGHVGATVYYGRMIPGFDTAPWLLIGSLLLMRATWRLVVSTVLLEKNNA